MKIILAVAGAKGKNVVFVSDTLRAYPLEEAVHLAKDGGFEGVYAVNGKHGAYLRTRPSVPKTEELKTLAVSSHQLFDFANAAGTALSHLALNQYLQLYERTLKRRERLPFIAIGGIARVSKKAAQEKLQSHKGWIFEAAKEFNVDPYLLGAIIIDELARFAPWEPITDPVGGYYIGTDTSAGIAQVTVETARGLIRDGYYNPDPSDPKLSLKQVENVPRRDLYEYVKQPKHSIFFAAAHMRALMDKWKRFVDLSKRPEIIATLYSIGRGKPPHGNPQPNKRGLQISDGFYRFAREWLS